MAEFDNPDLDPGIRTVTNIGAPLLRNYAGIHIEVPPTPVPLDRDNIGIILKRDPSLARILGLTRRHLWLPLSRAAEGLNAKRNAYFFQTAGGRNARLYKHLHENAHSFLLEHNPSLDDDLLETNMVVQTDFEEGGAQWITYEAIGTMAGYTEDELPRFQKYVLGKHADDRKMPIEYVRGHAFVARSTGVLMPRGLTAEESIILITKNPPLTPAQINHPEEYARSLV